MTVYQKLGKRLIDVVLAGLGLALLWPIFLVIAILIKLDSEGSVIFKQKRVGQNGQVFVFYKFRTMVKNAEKLKQKYQNLNEANGPVFKIKDDPRFTDFGKKLSRTGLDELPQLFNILKGEMSLVGPRPLPVEEEAKIPKKSRKKRRSIKPGLVSPWTANGANHSDFSNWIQSDLKYIENFSLKEDIEIIFRTILMLIR